MQDPRSIYDFTVKNDKGDEVSLACYKGKGWRYWRFLVTSLTMRNRGLMLRLRILFVPGFKSEFPIFDKIEVNGENAAPLYKYLKSGKWGMFKDDIQWNFAKFLVDRSGVIAHRFYPTTSPLTIEGDIEKLLETDIS
ncbi:hypothetical protein MLD38_016517 [Melastoma candidum]|uniref:Uncharacterized protein n=1 Tax=Melastoma candidum TaxID=119954 RepID=A0ACB9QNX6_9MYRT|nr:hypothetical protein MLD38_016517 [Melastoma candidum]